MNSSRNGRFFKKDRRRSLFLTALTTLIVISIIVSGPAARAQTENDPIDPAIAALEERLDAVRLAIFGGSPDAVSMAEEAEEIASSLPVSPHQTELLVKSIRFQAAALDDLGRTEEALERLDRAELIPLPENSIQKGGLFFGRARIADAMGDFGVALVNYRKAYDIYLAADYLSGQSIVLGQMAQTYFNARQYERTIEYIKRSREVYSGNGLEDLARHNNMAVALKALGRADEAIDEFNKALELAEEENLDNWQQLVLGNLAGLEISRNNYPKAYELADRALSIKAARKGDHTFVNALAARAELDRLTGRFAEAEATIKTIFTLVDAETTEMSIYDVHETAYKLYEELGDYQSAFAHFGAFKRLEDNVTKLASDANNSILSAEFEFAQKELEIERLRTGQLESDAALAGAARRQTRTVIIGLVVLGLGVIGIVVWRYLSMRRTQRVTQNLNRELSTKNNELASSNTQLEKANQAKMEFLATTSHEVRTPLNAIIGLTDVILAADEFSDGDREHLEVVNTSGRNLLHILDDILDVSKLEAGRMQVNLSPLNITDCMLDVAELWRNAAEEKGLGYVIDVSDGLGEYLCDDRLIRQVVSNLLSNAIKFTREGNVTVELKAIGNGFEITVRDTGIGVAADQQAMIFETFRQADNRYQRAYGGTGLGLAICKKIVEALGGNISLTSEPGKGAVFKVAIPAKKCEIAENAAGWQTEEPSSIRSPEMDHEMELSVIRVLVAEDNPANALVISAMLSGQVAQIVVVENGAEAVKAIQEQSFDVILMDKQMPVMDGAAATREIRALPEPFCNIPIVGLTAHILSDSRKECLDSGMDAYLTKPVPTAKLKETIIDAIKARRTIAA